MSDWHPTRKSPARNCRALSKRTLTWPQSAASPAARQVASTLTPEEIREALDALLEPVFRRADEIAAEVRAYVRELSAPRPEGKPSRHE